ncbi:hypothetical protein PGT21_009479 [Puccinia graminis f. sp. tritici]|uniref:Uncharacterized protein n=1 Tax=Puccinia graminis f. sp. tritici TaxID=56615 RepID=A0A5B0LUR9_PUCGR|nr:hypothetical protein PGT21_009479 [Puccinia graminis f. sp. tritici]
MQCSNTYNQLTVLPPTHWDSTKLQLIVVPGTPGSNLYNSGYCSQYQAGHLFQEPWSTQAQYPYPHNSLTKSVHLQMPKGQTVYFQTPDFPGTPSSTIHYGGYPIQYQPGHLYQEPWSIQAQYPYPHISPTKSVSPTNTKEKSKLIQYPQRYHKGWGISN